MTLKELAEQIQGNLELIEVKGDSNNTRVVWKDDTPENIRLWFRDVQTENDSFADLDEKYIVLDNLCNIILENDADADLEEAIYEHEWADVYNAALLEWLGASLYRISEVDDALKDGATGVMEAIQMAQSSNCERLAIDILAAMEAFVVQVNK